MYIVNTDKIPNFHDLKNIELTKQIMPIERPILIADDFITSQIKSDKKAIIPDNLNERLVSPNF